MDYWNECVAEALCDAEVVATDKQIEVIADWIEGAHDNYGMAFGHDCIPNPVTLENESLKKELQRERDKLTCPDCNGSGSYVSHGPFHSAYGTCSKCNGDGRIDRCRL